MTLSNKRIQYTVVETANDFKLQGEVSINETQNTFTLSGTFQDENNQHLGNFNYSERNGSVIDKNMNGIQKSNFAALSSLVDTVVAAIHTELESI